MSELTSTQATPLSSKTASSGRYRSRRWPWMTYIVERNRFYVVSYDGLDPLTGRERRRWIPIGHDRAKPRRSPHNSTSNVFPDRHGAAQQHSATSPNREPICQRTSPESSL